MAQFYAKNIWISKMKWNEKEHCCPMLHLRWLIVDVDDAWNKQNAFAFIYFNYSMYINKNFFFSVRSIRFDEFEKLFTLFPALVGNRCSLEIDLNWNLLNVVGQVCSLSFSSSSSSSLSLFVTKRSDAKWIDL